MRKVTMKDIAKQADVTVATVSYVLNNVQNQTIPGETKDKILRIAKELNYIPNLNARSLIKGKSKLVGILVVRNYKDKNPWRELRYADFVNQLERMLTEMGYHVLISSVNIEDPRLDIILERELDGVLLLDVREDIFFNISNRFTVPILIIDSYIEHYLFHKIVPDFNEGIEKAKNLLEASKPLVVLDMYNNNKIVERIKNDYKADVHVMENEEKLREFLEGNDDRKVIVINEFIGILAGRYVKPENMAVVCTCGCSYLLPEGVKKVIFDNAKKSQLVVKLMIDYIDKKYSPPEDKCTVIKSD